MRFCKVTGQYEDCLLTEEEGNSKILNQLFANSSFSQYLCGAKKRFEMKSFNITGTCRPNEHYMVDITERLSIIRKMIDKGDYFCINRGRQYGKTTTLRAVSHNFSDDYCIFSISFEGISESSYAGEERLYASFVYRMAGTFAWKPLMGLDAEVGEYISTFAEVHEDTCSEKALSKFISTICHRNTKPIVLLIDEVDQASNYPSFLKLLGLLRSMYLNRDIAPTFQSVILAGVHDIKNLKLRIRTEGSHIPNSPWNIASPFDVDMSLQEEGIRLMLDEYEADHHTGMNTAITAKRIRSYTHGYPFLVSRLCMLMDEQKDWSREGFFRAEKTLLNEKNTFFDDINKKLAQYPEMRLLLRSILFNGSRLAYNSNVEWQEICLMYGYLRMDDDTGAVAIDNRIVETMLYNKFIDEEQLNNLMYNQGSAAKMNYTHDGQLDMEHILAHFCTSFEKIYGKEPEEFIEREGRRLFMMYMRPIINGTGHFYVEDQTRDLTRTDLIIDYLGQQYVIEMKIWHGDAYNKRGERQLAAYMDYYDTKKAYMLSFCFNKKKQTGLRPPVQIGDRVLIEAIV